MTAFMEPADVRDVYAPKTPLPESTYPDELLASFIGAFEQAVITATAMPLAPKTITVEAVATRSGVLIPVANVRSIDAVSWLPSYYDSTTVATVLDEDALTALPAVQSNGLLRGIGASLDALVTLEVTYGYDGDEPADARIVCAEYVRKRALETIGNKPRNATPTGDSEGFSYTRIKADPKNQRWTGVDVVDDAINLWPNYRLPGMA